MGFMEDFFDDKICLGLWSSRDGENWANFNTDETCDILKLGNSGSWDDSQIKSAELINHGEEDWIYYTGRDVPNRQGGVFSIGVAFWRKDGLTHLASERGGGYVVTRKIDMAAIKGKHLFLNTDSDFGGVASIEVLDENFNVIRGFSSNEFSTREYDNIYYLAKWGGNTRFNFNEDYIRLKITFNKPDVKLFAYEFA